MSGFRTAARAGICCVGAMLLAVALCPVALAQGALTNGANHTGVIAVGVEHAWTFQAAQRDSIVVGVGEIAGSGPDPGFDPWIRLYGPDGTWLSEDWGSNGARTYAQAPLTGTYTVRVAEAGTQAGPGKYSLTIAKTPGPYSVSAGDEGGPATNGANHSGVISPGDIDPWTFEAAKNDSIAVSIGEVLTSGADPGFDPWIRLYGPDGSWLTEDWGSNAANLYAQAPLTGTYTVVVAEAGTQSGAGKYSLTFAKTPGPYSIASGDEGGPMTNGANHPGMVLIGDLDAWTFQATKNDSIAVKIGEILTSGGDPDFDPWIRLYGPDGTWLTEDWGSNAADLYAQAQLTGTYTVIVTEAGTQSGAGKYSLTFAKTPGPYTVSPGDEGGPMTNGIHYNGVIPGGDLDPWTFQAAKNDDIALRIDEVISGPDPDFDPWIRLYAPDGTWLTEDWGSKSGQIAMRAPLAGTYTVLVTEAGNQSGPGSYSLTVSGLTNSVPIPVVTAFHANPPTIQSGQSSTLSWSTTNATTVSISGAGAALPANGSVSVSPSTTTSYSLLATGAGGTASATTTVTVEVSETASGTLNRLRFAFGNVRRRAVSPLAADRHVIMLAKGAPDERFTFPITASINDASFSEIDVIDGVLTLSGAPGAVSLEDWLPRGGSAHVSITNGNQSHFGVTLDRGATEISVAALSTSILSENVPLPGDPTKTTPVRIEILQPNEGAKIVVTKRTWIVIHGRLNSSGTPEIQAIAREIKRKYQDDQVLLLDWESAARAVDSVGLFSYGEKWIEPIGQWAAQRLKAYKFDRLKVNLVGHSWGSYVAEELAQELGGVNLIVALDPASNTLAHNSDFNPNDPGRVDFGANSQFSVAFHSSESFGNETTPTTAHEAFSVGFFLPNGAVNDLDRHGWIRDLFTTMILGNGAVSQLFKLDRLLKHEPGPWRTDKYGAADAYSPFAFAPKRYEAVIRSRSTDHAPEDIWYFDDRGQEITLREDPFTVSIASLTPVANQTVTPGLPVIFTITVVDGDNVPVRGATVGGHDYLKDQDFVADPTDANGKTGYTMAVPFATGAGTYAITFTASLQGNVSAQVTRYVKVVTVPFALSIASVAPSATPTLSAGQSATYKVIVADGGGAPVGGVAVTGFDALKNQAVSAPLTGDDGVTNYTTTVPSGATAGAYNITFTASRAGYISSSQVTRSVQVMDTGAALSIDTTALSPSAATTGVRYEAQAIRATGGQTPYAWSATGLPSGVTIHATSGVISGTPTAAGVFSIIVTVKDNSNPRKTDTQPLVLTVAAATPLTTTLAVPSVTSPVSMSLAFTPVTASGGVQPYSFAISSPLPAGMNFNTGSGHVNGTPTTTLAAKTFTVTATDALGTKSAKSFTLTITAVVTVGNVTSTLKELDGDLSQASLTRQWLYTTPLKTVDGSNPATFSNVPTGTYRLEGYHDETFWGKELWASTNVSITAGQTTNKTLNRNFPYATAVIRNDTTGAVILTDQTVPVGTMLRAEVTVHNPSGTTQSSRVQFRFDRNHSSSYDYDQPSTTKTINSGGTQIHTFTYLVPTAGTYDYALAVYTTVSGDPVLTDSWGWTQGVIVTDAVTTGNVTSTLRNLDGSNSQPSNTLQWLYTSPIMKIDGSNPANFNNVPAGTYLLEGYHDETPWGDELWTSKNVTVIAGQMITVTLNRDYPYASAVIKNDATGAVISGQSVPMGTKLRAEVTVHNPANGTTHSCRVRFRFDRSHSSSYDFDDTSLTKTVGSGATQLYTFTHTPTSTGTYDYTLAVETTVQGDPVRTDSWGWATGVTISSSTGCGDSRDQIIAEYAALGGYLSPTCSSFTQTASAAHFTFAELNVNNPYSWAIIRFPLTASASASYGLERWRANAGGVPRYVNSAYRPPQHNQNVGGVPNSRHIFGDAVDLRNVPRTEAEYNLLRNAALDADAGYVEPLTGSCGYGCVHADWRNK